LAGLDRADRLPAHTDGSGKITLGEVPLGAGHPELIREPGTLVTSDYGYSLGQRFDAAK
jgi:hypothetical protein